VSACVSRASWTLPCALRVVSRRSPPRCCCLCDACCVRCRRLCVRRGALSCGTAVAGMATWPLRAASVSRSPRRPRCAEPRWLCDALQIRSDA
jgi:hypothetical protein